MTDKKIKFNGRQFIFNIRNEADESVSAEIYKHREYRAADEAIINATDPIVDVGAHAGFFTLYARALNPSISIFAIEPEPQNVALLHQHLKDNKAEDEVTVVASALAASTGQRQLILSEDLHNHRLAYGNQDIMAGKGEVAAKHLKVPTVSFSDFCEQYHLTSISLLKIDIEGGEYEVFESFKDEDFRRIKAIMMEYHDLDGRRHQELEELFRVNGFSVKLFPSKFDKTMGFIFAQNKKSKKQEIKKSK